jgi:oxygen-independent coproporphyrinogen-3 oxidase
MSPLGLYLHFPWCVRKCPYCDFNSHPVRGPLQEAAYLDALDADLSVALADVTPRAVTSVFCGGGTPSLFSPQAFEGLLRRLEPWLARDAEITMEANPGTVEHHDFAAYRHAGINRLSLGAQSFSAVELARLGRIHGPEDTVRAFAKARHGGFDNINLDLMYGLPGQSRPEALADLRRAIGLAPEHVSWYQLTIEAKTEFARRPPLLASHDEIADMEADGLSALAEAGYRRYEISAFARRDRQCRHNLNYWRFGDYVGAGAGAHGKRSRGHGARLSIVRTRKPPQPRRYLRDPARIETAQVNEAERVFEFLMNALRLVEGAPIALFECRTGLPRGALEPQWSALVAEGLVREDRVAATEAGLRHLDTVLQRFLR